MNLKKMSSDFCFQLSNKLFNFIFSDDKLFLLYKKCMNNYFVEIKCQ